MCASAVVDTNDGLDGDLRFHVFRPAGRDVSALVGEFSRCGERPWC